MNKVKSKPQNIILWSKGIQHILMLTKRSVKKYWQLGYQPPEEVRLTKGAEDRLKASRGGPEGGDQGS